ncbi:Zinc finger, CCHC-type [Sesbania bispinosa]|nr:Zinc finger, CCHC-type [Sesbania bispinosa]
MSSLGLYSPLLRNPKPLRIVILLITLHWRYTLGVVVVMVEVEVIVDMDMVEIMVVMMQCFNCGELGHYQNWCPHSPQNQYLVMLVV